MSIDLPPDPFEDLAAPPMRLGPPRLRPVPSAGSVPVQPAPAVLPLHEDAADHPFRLTAIGPAESLAPPQTADAIPSVEAADASTPVETAGAAGGELRAPARSAAAESASPGLRQLRAAVAVGLLTAAAIVALAVAFRPESLEIAAEPDAVPTALGSGPVPAPGAEAAASTAAADVAVRLRIDPDLADGRRAAFEAATDAAGYGSLEVSPTTAPIDRGRIEYFHPADKDAAEALARSLAPLTGGPVAVHDLSAVTLGAEPGRIDAWIAD